ncbi:hypothetical protein HPB48_012553 [Haemaphysalis longicornis]|uniref:Zinc transporter 6 n=1 Tax=Haemaphysalis longicornis TaxID=44386 RepID=A0A9J6GLS8_HAELO|nr:hypothetical protein HPB48_012553 [Haemaphysalis longicornis]
MAPPHMSTEEEAEEALKNLNSYSFMGSTLSVERSTSKFHQEPGAPGRAKGGPSRPPYGGGGGMQRNGYDGRPSAGGYYNGGPYADYRRGGDFYDRAPYRAMVDRPRPYPAPYERRDDPYAPRRPPPGPPSMGGPDMYERRPAPDYALYSRRSPPPASGCVILSYTEGTVRPFSGHTGTAGVPAMGRVTAWVATPTVATRHHTIRTPLDTAAGVGGREDPSVLQGRWGRFLPATVLGLCWHLLVQLTVRQPSLASVLQASSSSWLQEHLADISHSVCSVVPGLSGLLLPRLNPILLLGWAEACLLLFCHTLLLSYDWQHADTVTAVFLAIMCCATMLPVSVHCACVLLQTTPGHLLGQLDKCLREASTLDGVLEFRHELFWTLSFGTLAGSVHVRVRRDANEQLVLAHVVDRLSALVPELTVQVFKDEWAWSRAAPFHTAREQAPALERHEHFVGDGGPAKV